MDCWLSKLNGQETFASFLDIMLFGSRLTTFPTPEKAAGYIEKNQDPNAKPMLVYEVIANSEGGLSIKEVPIKT
jgi:hypothetical protein